MVNRITETPTDLHQRVSRGDSYTNSLIGCIVSIIVSAVIYGYTKSIVFIVLVGILLCCGVFCSSKRKVLIKDIVRKVNQQIKKK